MTSTAARRPPSGPLWLVVLLCVLAAALARVANHAWVEPDHRMVEAGLAEAGHRTSAEPDGLYHMRRVERALEEGTIASTDARLNFPEGANIPWPSFADHAALSFVRFGAPDDPAERRAFIERRLGVLPFWFGLATCALLAFAAGRLFRSELAAAVTGLTYALCFGVVNYQVPGIADHHAWVSLLNACALVTCCFAWREKTLMNVHTSVHKGGAAGVLMGLSLGSWVASLLWLGALQLAMGMLWLQAGRGGRYEALAPGLRAFGLAFHAAALLILLPEAITSPWAETHPWMVVNLSWFHPTVLLLGLLVFVPKRHGRFPAPAVPFAIAAVGTALLLFNIGPGAGVREGFAWVSRADEFMSGIAESHRLTDGYLHFTGIGVVLLIFVALGWKRRAFRGARPEYAGLSLVLLLGWVQAVTQIRFVEAMMVPGALAYGWLTIGVVRRLQAWLPKRTAAWKARSEQLRYTVALFLAIPLSFALVGPRVAVEPLNDALNKVGDSSPEARRHALEWIGARAPQLPAAEADASVLAPWDWGHEIEWRSGHASVATNFGSYVGVDGYRAPARFFLATDAGEAESLLKRHQVRYVIRSSKLTLSMDQLERSYGEGLPEGGIVRRFEDAQGRERSEFRPVWFHTMAAALGVGMVPRADGRLPRFGDPDGQEGPRSAHGFLRLVHVSPFTDHDFRHGGLLQPHAMIWEVVEGARVSTALAPGETLEIRMGVQVTPPFGEPVRFEFVAREAGPVRVPYNTGLPMGDAEVAYAQWRVLGADEQVVREGELHLTEEAVQDGAEVRLD